MRIAGETIAKLRWLRGWGIKDLSDRAGINRNTLRAIENGTSPGSPRSLVNLARALEVNPMELIIEEDGELDNVHTLDSGGREREDNGATIATG